VPIVPLYGHAALRQRLATSVSSGRIPASILLQGPRGIGKQRLALWLGQLLLCERPGDGEPCGSCMQCRFTGELTHPDLHWFFPRPRLKDGDATAVEVRADFGEAIAERVAAHGLYAPPPGTEALYVATMRAVVQTAGISPAMARKKVYVIGEAERMVPQEGADAAANAFLKLLEEPPADTILILTSSEPGALLPTIRSRVVSVRVPPLTDTDVAAFLENANVHATLGDADRMPIEERARAVGGAPGALIGGGEQIASMGAARLLLDAATAADRATRFRVAFAQGGAKARGSFTDTLDALTTLLHGRSRRALGEGREHDALAAARAVQSVEDAKARAAGNVSPALVSASLLASLSRTLGSARGGKR
jgi:DNA polymerase-3 subunit delta'